MYKKVERYSTLDLIRYTMILFLILYWSRSQSCQVFIYLFTSLKFNFQIFEELCHYAGGIKNTFTQKIQILSQNERVAGNPDKSTLKLYYCPKWG